MHLYSAMIKNLLGVYNIYVKFSWQLKLKVVNFSVVRKIKGKESCAVGGKFSCRYTKEVKRAFLKRNFKEKLSDAVDMRQVRD